MIHDDCDDGSDSDDVQMTIGPVSDGDDGDGDDGGNDYGDSDNA